MNTKNIMVIVLGVVVFATVIFFITKDVTNAPAVIPPATTPIGTEPPQGNGRACTEEAKVCPDGSAVGRTGPNCEFAPCPVAKTVPKEGEQVFCTMDAKQCPNGLYVGRTGPNCEFVCPK